MEPTIIVVGPMPGARARAMLLGAAVEAAGLDPAWADRVVLRPGTVDEARASWAVAVLIMDPAVPIEDILLLVRDGHTVLVQNVFPGHPHDFPDFYLRVEARNVGLHISEYW